MDRPVLDSPRQTPSTPGADGSLHHGLLQLGRALAAADYRHTAIGAASHQRVVQRMRQAAAEPRQAATLGDVFGLSRPFSAEHLPARVWNAMNEAGVVRRDGALWRSTVRVASCAHRLYFHSAWPTIDDDAVFFGPDTYRMLTALQGALDEGPVRRAIDIGCGAGAGAITIARHWPLAEVLAVDGNPTATTLTAVNADLAGTPRVRVDRIDPLRSALDQVDGDFDLILAQPPYLLDPCGRLLRHGGGALGEARTIEVVTQAITRLAAGGRLLLYTGVAMVGGADPVLALLAPLLDGAGLAWRYRELEGDIHGEELAEAGYEQADRIAAVWLEARRP
jgi:precorrin-6B methylase 2